MAKPNETTSLETWAPSPEQKPVLDRYAIGYRWYAASREMKVPDSTMAEWMRDSRFRELGEQMRNEVTFTALPLYGATIERYQRILLRVKVAEGDGDLDPRDPVVLLALEVLGRTLWPVLLGRGMAGTGLDPRDALRATARS